ncbi:hypothetical protein Q5H92_24205 [Hymenobacter sp. M29]|uniref:Uncharacterized protein n=1 Tax=Hymenobacter mellowenesis TaxID=3063995 RepID=A0ABT9AHZ7_9BACT|nr:DUF6683 family protein [Hymenobacter sp. M29]MDO7849490.1 hypothetical protein [Hymenobacter sp. M29]
MKILPLVLSGALLLGPLFRSHGQVGPALDMTLMTGWTGGAAVQYDLEKRAAAAKGGNAVSAKAAPSYSYRPSPAMREQTVERAVEQLKPTNPTGASALASVFGPGKYDYDQTYAEIIKGTGLRATDAADAMACYLLMGYAIVHNLQDDKAIGPPLARGVRAQVANILAQNPNFKPDDPLAAAKFGEELKLQTVILQGGWQSAVKQKAYPAYRNTVAQNFRTGFGLDLSQLKLTTQGFAKR